MRIRFVGFDYGDFTVCMSRKMDDNTKDCRSIEGFGDVWFNQSYPCSAQDNVNSCSPIYFTVTMDSTFLKCSENDCRYPDQVRYVVRPEGLRCDYNASNKLLIPIILIFSAILLHYANKFNY